MSIDSFLLIVNTRIAVIATDHRQRSTLSSFYFNSLFWQPTSICYCFVKFTVDFFLYRTMQRFTPSPQTHTRCGVVTGKHIAVLATGS